MASNENDNDKNKDMEEAFKVFDYDNDGKISVRELGAVMRALGCNPTQEEIHELMAENDLDDSGFLDFDEFVTMMTTKFEETNAEEELMRAFEVFDFEGDGYVSEASFREVMLTVGEKLTKVEVDEMMREAAPVGGKINYEAFVKLISK